MPTTGKPWTAEEDEILRTEIVSGASRCAISQKLGRSESAVKARAYILRLSLRPSGTKGRSDSQPANPPRQSPSVRSGRDRLKQTG